MSQRTRMAVGTLVLAGFAAGLGAGVYFGVYRPHEAQVARTAADARLLPQHLGTVTGLTVQKHGGPKVVMRKQAGGWEIVSPVQVKADDATARTLVDRLGEAKLKTTVATAKQAPKVLHKYGLDHPSLAITVSTAAKSYPVVMGMQNDFDHQVYVRVGDGPVGLVPTATKLPLNKSLFDLREKRLLRFQQQRLEALEVTLPDQHYRLARGKGGRWQVTGLVDDRADPGTVKELVGALTGVRAVAFPDGPPAGFGLDHPAVTVGVDLEGGTHLDLKLASRKDGGITRWYAVGTQVQGVAQVPTDTEGRLAQTPFGLRYKTVVHFDRGAARKLSVKAPGGGFTAVLQDKPAGADAGFSARDVWALTAPVKAEATHWKIASALYQLMDLRATAFAPDPRAVHGAPDLAAYGLAPPARTYTVEGTGGKVLGVLHVGRRAPGKAGGYYASGADTHRVYVIAGKTVKALPTAPGDVQDAAKKPPKG